MQLPPWNNTKLVIGNIVMKLFLVGITHEGQNMECLSHTSIFITNNIYLRFQTDSTLIGLGQVEV